MPRDREVEIKTRDERSITVPVPCNKKQMRLFREFIDIAEDEGYTLATATEYNDGNQRDPLVVAVNLGFEKKS